VPASRAADGCGGIVRVWQINLSDVITRIPTVEEADKLNGRMKRFTGKAGETSRIAYGGFKAVPRRVTLVIRNAGERAATVKVTARLHDTYHENGEIAREATVKPGKEASVALDAPARKWIRRIFVTGNGNEGLRLAGVTFVMAPRNKLRP